MVSRFRESETFSKGVDIIEGDSLTKKAASKGETIAILWPFDAALFYLSFQLRLLYPRINNGIQPIIGKK